MMLNRPILLTREVCRTRTDQGELNKKKEDEPRGQRINGSRSMNYEYSWFEGWSKRKNFNPRSSRTNSKSNTLESEIILAKYTPLFVSLRAKFKNFLKIHFSFGFDSLPTLHSIRDAINQSVHQLPRWKSTLAWNVYPERRRGTEFFG